jgi:cytosine/adenosine deaminase-related metal-dependent hydrolase
MIAFSNHSFKTMPTLLAKNAEVLVAMDGRRRELKNAGLYAEDGIIKKVGPTEELPTTANTVIDLTGQICCQVLSIHTTISTRR